MVDEKAKQQIDTVSQGLQGLVDMLAAGQMGLAGQLQPLNTKIAESELRSGQRIALLENKIAGLAAAIGACEPRRVECVPAVARDGKSRYRCSMPQGIAGPLTVRVKQDGKETEYEVARDSAENPAFVSVGATTLDLVFDKAPESVVVVDEAGTASLVDKIKLHWTRILEIGKKLQELYDLVQRLIADQQAQGEQLSQLSGNQLKAVASAETQLQSAIEAGEKMAQDLQKIKNVLIGVAKAIGE